VKSKWSKEKAEKGVFNREIRERGEFSLKGKTHAWNGLNRRNAG
jgi:hypothetical protein